MRETSSAKSGNGTDGSLEFDLYFRRRGDTRLVLDLQEEKSKMTPGGFVGCYVEE